MTYGSTSQKQRHRHHAPYQKSLQLSDNFFFFFARIQRELSSHYTKIINPESITELCEKLMNAISIHTLYSEICFKRAMD